ncbi:MAG: TonB family protein [Candidatus Aminicenantes bacterium]
MNSKSIKYAVIFLILMVVFLWGTTAPAAAEDKGDILVHLRLYEGSRGNEMLKSSVVSSYYLKPLFVSNMVSEFDIKEEQKELKRIFNLTDIKLMTRTQWGWRYGEPEKRFKIMVLNGHEFQVQLTMIGKKNDFKVEVIDKGKMEQEPLLETVVILPEKKSTVFGFEDSLRKPFFICVQREANQPVIDKEPMRLPAGKGLKMIRRISPKYPDIALKKKIQGEVILDATLNREGKAMDIKVVNGPEELYQAAVDAVKEWRWRPVEIEGKIRPVKFTVVVNFDLPKKDDAEEETGLMDFYFENARLMDVLKYIAHRVEINIVVDPGISGRVSCQLEQVPWEKALDWMLELNGLDMIYKGNVLRILKAAPANKDLKKAAKEKKYTGELMSFNFYNAKIVDVLKIISKKAGLTPKIAPGVKGKVTVQLEKIPWDQALDLMLELNSLDWEVKGKVLKVFKKKEVQKKTSKPKETTAIPNILPTKGYLKEVFGTRENTFTNKIEFHPGIDIAAKRGSEVIAPADGIVISTDELRTGYGKLLIIDHGSGYTTYYGELETFKVKKGDKVKRGQVIGLVGNSGSHGEPHLHYEVRFKDKPINPMSLIRLQ